MARSQRNLWWILLPLAAVLFYVGGCSDNAHNDLAALRAEVAELRADIASVKADTKALVGRPHIFPIFEPHTATASLIEPRKALADGVRLAVKLAGREPIESLFRKIAADRAAEFLDQLLQDK